MIYYFLYKFLICAESVKAHLNLLFSFEQESNLCVTHIFMLLFVQIRKLRRELEASQEKVSTLTTQLSANVRTHTALHVQEFTQSSIIS